MPRLRRFAAGLGLLLALHAAPLAAPLAAQRMPDSASTTERTVTQVADGVYVIRHPDAPDAFPQGNTTVVVGDDGVLVVDACYLPSSAREDIAQIRQWTDRPVRYLVNTHWHYDHTMGNGVYAEAFPGLTIVAHAETARQSRGYNPGWFERFPSRADAFRRILETGETAPGQPLTDTDRADYEKALAGVAPVQAEYEALVDRHPDLTFDESVAFDLGGRVVQVLHLGRGNTAGDAVVYLPAEKILATGDLLVHPVPYLGGGYPFDFVETLDRMARLDVETYVPGHGHVLPRDYGRAYLGQVRAFIDTVATEVSRQVHRLGSGPTRLEQVREAVLQAVDVKAWRRRFTGDDAADGDFFESFSAAGVITAAYAQVWGR